MKQSSFHLQPFARPAVVPQLRVLGDIARHGDRIILDYLIQGNVDGLSIPASCRHPERRDQLWRDTCLELFLARGDAPAYWEFNMAPSGHWNVYRFTDYRRGMRNEPRFTGLPFTVRKMSTGLALSLDVGLQKIVDCHQPLKIGISAVVKQVDGDISYWALKHCAAHPDFHHREGHIITL